MIWEIAGGPSVKVKDPYAGDSRGFHLQYLTENGWRDPDFMLIKVTRGARWWDLDDVLREECLGVRGGRWTRPIQQSGHVIVTQEEAERAVRRFARDGLLKRLDLRRLP